MLKAPKELRGKIAKHMPKHYTIRRAEWIEARFAEGRTVDECAAALQIRKEAVWAFCRRNDIKSPILRERESKVKTAAEYFPTPPWGKIIKACFTLEEIYAIEKQAHKGGHATCTDYIVSVIRAKLEETDR